MKDTREKSRRRIYDDVIDLRELVRVLSVGKWLVGSVTLAAAVIALIVVLTLPNVYRAEALLAPNDQSSADGLAALATRYGGLASLAGLDIGSGSTDKVTMGLEILKSRRFITDFIDRHDILVPLIASDGWDPDTGELRIDSDQYDVTSKKWVREVSPPYKTVPSLQEAYEHFMDILWISQDATSGLVTVRVHHHSPEVAKQWVDWLIEDLNSSIMQQDVAEAEQAIEYLHEQIAKTSLADLQSVFFGLIEEQTKTVLLAKVTDEYLFKTLDPAVVPELKSSPKRLLIILLSALLGSIVAVAAVFVSSSPR